MAFNYHYLPAISIVPFIVSPLIFKESSFNMYKLINNNFSLEIA